MSSSSTSVRSYRIDSIDYLRGLVIAVMAIDHVRDYIGTGVTALDPMSDEASIWAYLTRFITHLCAPIFVFLAGTSAGLMTQRKGPRELGYFLLTRGLWLLFIELAVISHLWSFAPTGAVVWDGGPEIVAFGFQVIGAIGVSMMLLGAFQFFGAKVCLAVGLLIVLGHNGYTAWLPQPAYPENAPPVVSWWMGFYTPIFLMGDSWAVNVNYTPMQWFGIMLLGFGSSQFLQRPEAERNRGLIRLGVGLLVAFFVIRYTNVYGDPSQWESRELLELTLRDFFYLTKYPPSLLFCTFMLGSGALLLAFSNRVPRIVFNVLSVFGKAPFAVYVVHLFVIHLSAVLLGIWQGFEAEQMLNFYFRFPEGYGLSLWGVYVYWALLMCTMYPLARWVASVKSRRKHWWLSYL